MAISVNPSVLAFVATILFASGTQAATVFHEIEGNDTKTTANHIALHNGAIDVFGFQKADFDWFSFYGTAGDRLTLEVQDEGPNPNHPIAFHTFDSVMSLHDQARELVWDDDDDTHIDNMGDALPQRVRDKGGSYIVRTLGHSGLYFIRLENFGLNDFETYNYRLVVRGLTPTGPVGGAVPLPAGLPLLLTAAGVFGVFRKRSRS